MISNAFKSAYTSEVSAQNKGIDTITSGIKDAAILAAGITGFAGGFGSSKLGKAVASGAEHALAGRVGGIGGNIMLATLKQKKESAQAQQDKNKLLTSEEVAQTISGQLGDNPINRAAKKSLATVFDTLVKAKEEGTIKNGQIQTSMGKIDINSELGKKMLAEMDKEEKA